MCKKNESKDNQEVEMKFRFAEIIIGTISMITALVAVILSGISLCQTKDIINYQIIQEKMPKIVALNDTITSNFEVNYAGEIYNYELITDMCIPVYNIGMGIAQNCKINWDKNSVIIAVEEAKNNLEPYVFFKDFDYSKDGYPSLSGYDYIFEYINNELDSIMFYEHSSAQVNEFCFDFSSTDTAYALPITEQGNKILVEIPKPISVMLLEYANHNISNSIKINLEIMYEDIAENTYNETFCVEFLVKHVSNIENDELDGNNIVMCEYDVIVNKVQV